MAKHIIIMAILAFCQTTSIAVMGLPSSNEHSGITSIRGRILTPEGSPVKGINLCCYIRDPNKNNDMLGGRCQSDKDGNYQFSVQSGRLIQICTSDTRISFFATDHVLADTSPLLMKDLIVLPRDAVLGGRVLREDETPGTGLSYGWFSDSYMGYFPQETHLTDLSGSFLMTDAPRERMTFWIEVKPDTVQVWTDLKPNTKDVILKLDPNEYIDLPPEWQLYGDLRAHQRKLIYEDVGARIDFTLPDLQGNLVSLQSNQLKGKVVLVNIFGSWCGGCLAEIPYLVLLKEKYVNDGLEIVGISFERGNSREASIAAVRKLMTKFKINYPVLIGGETKREHVISTIRGLNKFEGYPTTLFIGRDGTTEEVKIGFDKLSDARGEWHLSNMEEVIIRILKQQKDNKSIE